jgi:hypothetical protein
MDNPEKLVALGTQDTGRRHTTQKKHNTENSKNTDPTKEAITIRTIQRIDNIRYTRHRTNKR